MDFVVPDHIAYCFIAERPMFMDINRDRYFAVSERLGATFAAAVRDRAQDRPSAEIDALLRSGLLRSGGPERTQRRPVIMVRRQNDVLNSACRGTMMDTVGVASAVLAAQHRIRKGPFSTTIAQLSSRWATAETTDAEQTAVIAARFLRRRALVPVPSVCLLDCLALLQFMKSRGGQADLVFGVIPSPFAAHCWLQRDDQVLNDQLERVSAFTPILVV